MFRSPKYEPVGVQKGMTKIWAPGATPGRDQPIGQEPNMVVDSRTVNVTISVTKFFPGGGNAGAGGVTLDCAQVKATLDRYNI